MSRLRTRNFELFLSCSWLYIHDSIYTAARRKGKGKGKGNTPLCLRTSQELHPHRTCTEDELVQSFGFSDISSSSALTMLGAAQRRRRNCQHSLIKIRALRTKNGVSPWARGGLGLGKLPISDNSVAPLVYRRTGSEIPVLRAARRGARTCTLECMATGRDTTRDKHQSHVDPTAPSKVARWASPTSPLIVGRSGKEQLIAVWGVDPKVN